MSNGEKFTDVEHFPLGPDNFDGTRCIAIITTDNSGVNRVQKKFETHLRESAHDELKHIRTAAGRENGAVDKAVPAVTLLLDGR